MIVLRNKSFSQSVPKPGEIAMAAAQGEQPSAGDLQKQSQEIQLQQMRLQKQRLLIQHQKQQMQVKEGIAKAKELLQRQKLDKEEKEADDKMMLKARQHADGNSRPDNTSLYKSKSKAVQPVPMKN